MAVDPRTQVATGRSIDPATSLGLVSLTVSDLSRAHAFYEGVLGLLAAGGDRDAGQLVLTDAGGHPLVVLHEDRDAPPFDPSGNGLFHLALLVPDRRELARSLRRIASTGWPLTGASDHLVSEALYLRDPDGNGIEVYRDRPRSQWQTDGRGSIRMATLALDLDDVLAEFDGADGADGPVAAGTRMGHVHLQVGQLDAAERFYCGVLGFEPTARGYPGALFASAGGYHHHIGLNTWQSLGAPPVAPGGVGLRSFEVVLPDAAALDRVLARIPAAGSVCESCNVAAAAVLVRDPFGIAIVLRSA
jgi:catechol 2,3-dioxygenase